MEIDSLRCPLLIFEEEVLSHLSLSVSEMFKLVNIEYLLVLPLFTVCEIIKLSFYEC